MTESEKLPVAVINFEGPSLYWYRSQAEREAFVRWEDLKQKMLIRFEPLGMEVWWDDFYQFDKRR